MTEVLTVDGDLVAEALRLGDAASKSAVVESALAEYIRLRRAEKLIALSGTVDYHPGYPKGGDVPRTPHDDERAD